ncbi:MAG: glycosyltransferase family 39 protein [Acidobacteriaceae bacterium]|nr:glycosyltransferase family 39 protein [Acidobacteriaceae bacterium]
MLLAHGKVLWGDEFVTYWVGQQRSFHGIWSALRSGADPNPPLMHVLSWWSTSLFGSNALAIRLPSIAGVGLAVASLWFLVRRYASRSAAAAACLALMATRGFDYSYDARSYGLLLGFALASLFCWTRTLPAPQAKSSSDIVSISLMALFLAADLSSNYYGVMAFFPIAAGELALSWQHKRLRWPVWAGLGLASLPLFGYLPLIHGNIAEFGPHAWNKPSLSILPESYFLLVEGVFWPVAFLALWYGVIRKKATTRSEALTPVALRVALAVLLLYPLLGFAIAYGGAGMISARCVIPVCGAFALTGAFLLERLGSRRLLLGSVAFLSLWVIARESACGILLLQQRHAFFQLRNAVESAQAPGEPVFVADSLVVMPLWWYSSASLRQQLRFPIDFDLIHRSEADDSGEQNLWGGRHGVFPVPIDRPEALLAPGSEAIFLGNPNGWLGRSMTTNGWHLQADAVPVPWENLGGVFTPLVHPETRVWFASPR